MELIDTDSFRDEKGRLLPGHGGLKKPGSNNRLQGEIKNKITEFLAGKLENLEDMYSKVSAKDKLRFLSELLAYVLPKCKEITNITSEPKARINYSALPDDVLKQVLNNTEYE
jgi:hypothetical protein